MNRITSTPSQSYISLKCSCSGVSSLRTNTRASFARPPIELMLSGLPPHELASHAHSLFEIAVGEDQIIKHKAAKVLTRQQQMRDKGADQSIALYVNRGDVVYGSTQAFCLSRKLIGGSYHLQLLMHSTQSRMSRRSRTGEGSPKVNASIFSGALAVMLVCLGCFFWRLFILVNIQNGI